jgi:hypothetical protein
VNGSLEIDNLGVLKDNRCKIIFLIIDRAKDWVEWTMEKPPRVMNSRDLTILGGQRDGDGKTNSFK